VAAEKDPEEDSKKQTENAKKLNKSSSFAAFTGVGRALGSGKPMARPATAAAIRSLSAAPLAAAADLASQFDAQVRQALGLPSAERLADDDARLIPAVRRRAGTLAEVVVADGGLLRPIKRAGGAGEDPAAIADGSGAHATGNVVGKKRGLATNVSQSSLLTGSYQPPRGHLDALTRRPLSRPSTAPAGGDRGASSNTNVAQSRLLQGRLQEPSGDANTLSSPPAAATAPAAPAPAGKLSVTVMDAATYAYTAVPRHSLKSTDFAFVKVVFIDKAAVEVAPPTAAPITPLYIQLGHAASLSQLFSAIKAHRRKMAYIPGPISAYLPYNRARIAEVGSLKDADLNGKSLIVHPS
jgi:hypothetical protein